MNAANNRKRILFAAIEVFAEKGKHRARMEDIASKAAVSKSSVYRSYPTKNDLFKEVLGVVVEEVLQKLEDAAGPLDNSGDFILTLRRVANAFLDVFFQSPDLGKVALHAMVNDAGELLSAARNAKSRVGRARMAAFKALIEDVAAKASEKGLTGVNPEHLLTVVIGINLTYLLGKPIAEVLLGLRISDEKAFLDETKRNIVDLWTHGICKFDPRDG